MNPRSNGLLLGQDPRRGFGLLRAPAARLERGLLRGCDARRARGLLLGGARAIASGLLLALLAVSATAQPTGGRAAIQDHSTTAQGGSTLAPKILSMLTTSTATFSGRVSLTPPSVTWSGSTGTISTWATVPGIWRTVASSNTFGVSVTTGTNFVMALSSSTRVRFRWVGVVSATTELGMTVNSVSSGTWFYNFHYGTANGTSGDTGSNVYGYCGFTAANATDVPGTGDHFVITGELFLMPDNPSIVQINAEASFYATPRGTHVTGHTSCTYKGGAAITSFGFKPVSGNVRQSLEIEVKDP